MYDVHLGLIRKPVVDFLLVIIELFSLDVTAEALRTKIYGIYASLLQRCQFDPKFQVEGVAPPFILFFQKTMMINALSCGIKIWTDFSFVLSQYTRLTDGRTDRQTDRILIARSRLHSMQRGKNRPNGMLILSMRQTSAFFQLRFFLLFYRILSTGS